MQLSRHTYRRTLELQQRRLRSRNWSRTE